MDGTGIKLSRIDKLFVDRDQAEAAAARTRRENFHVAVACGEDVARSRTSQALLLTAANIASRCFPGALNVVMTDRTANAPLLIWPKPQTSIREALAGLLGSDAIVPNHDAGARILVLGDRDPPSGALRVTFDGWIAKVGPAAETERLPEREYCPLAGILAAALGMSELFLSFADVSIEAGRRTLALSLWRPDLDASDPAALGEPMQYLPASLWVLGLGHLGNAYLWALAALPYADPSAVTLYLNDFDTVESENVETGLIFQRSHIGSLKTRVTAEWLKARGLETRLVERRFDRDFRCREDEPRLALCGFDSNDVRRHLATARFLRVVESGLGGTAGNFDTLSFHTLPNRRTAAELWPDLSADEEAKREKERERAARENPAYRALHGDECGRFGLAGKSVAVPFVGAAAGAFVVAETVKLFHAAPAYTDAKLSLAAPARRSALTNGCYSASDAAGLAFVTADPRFTLQKDTAHA